MAESSHVNFYSAFVDENYRKAREAQAKDREAAVKAYDRQTESRRKNSPISI